MEKKSDNPENESQGSEVGDDENEKSEKNSKEQSMMEKVLQMANRGGGQSQPVD